jgi:uncharacterized membrane protein YdfJ with MMPL/SSD domain
LSARRRCSSARRWASLGASGVASLKRFGAGVAHAVIVDATGVRALLVRPPMALLGRASW